MQLTGRNAGGSHEITWVDSLQRMCDDLLVFWYPLERDDLGYVLAICRSLAAASCGVAKSSELGELVVLLLLLSSLDRYYNNCIKASISS